MSGLDCTGSVLIGRAWNLIGSSEKSWRAGKEIFSQSMAREANGDKKEPPMGHSWYFLSRLPEHRDALEEARPG